MFKQGGLPMKKSTKSNPEWSDDLLTGNEKIDLQHKSLFKLLENLVEDINHQALHPVISELEKYAKQHFEDEEKLQKEVRYPKYAEHKAIHELLLEEIAIVKKKVEEGTYSGNARIRVFLTKWLRDHILEIDKEFVDFYHQKQNNKSE